MTNEQIILCENLIKDLLNQELKEKEQSRNKLFEILYPEIYQWIISFLVKRSIVFDTEDIKSKSWECFEYCLKTYHPEKKIPIPNHFYAYTRFLLSTIQTKERKINHYEKEETTSDEEDEIVIGDNISGIYGHIDELKKFKDFLLSSKNNEAKEYAIVLDDAILSLVPGRKLRVQRQRQTELSYPRYNEAKKLLKIMVQFLLLR